MRPATRPVLVALFAFHCCAFLPLWVLAQTKPASVTAATVSGRVTIKGKPAAGVVVGMRRSEAMNPYEILPRATTDHDGLYRIKNVTAGSYEVSPVAPALVLVDANNARGKTVVISESENVEDINFSMVRGGVITGKIVDGDGRPVIQQSVSLFRADAFEQQPQRRQQPIYQLVSASTDDRGIYRMFGVAAGRYKVAAGRGDETFSPSVTMGRASFKQVFHPDVTDSAKAAIIEVTEGSEATNVDITLGALVQTFAVSGRVIDEKGFPVLNLRFGLQMVKGERSTFVTSLVSSNNNGDFVVEGLIPGKYGVFVMQELNNDLRADPLTFEILDQDISGLTVRMSRGASIGGMVVLESEDKDAYARLIQMRLGAYLQNAAGGGSGMGQSGASTIAGDGSFRITGLPGGTANFYLSRMYGDNQPRFSISRIERDGIVQSRTLEIRDGEHVTGVRIFVVVGNATLRGTVKFENGTLPANGSVFVRITRAGETNSNIRPPRVDARGHFLIEGLVPGLYNLLVSVAAPVASPRSQTRQQVDVQDGVLNEVTITLDLGPQPKP